MANSQRAGIDLQNPRLPGDLNELARCFLAHVGNPNVDPAVCELRRSLTREKREALDEIQDGGDRSHAQIMQSLYTRAVSTNIQMSARVGVSVALALEAYDEHVSGVSLSSFDRGLREEVTETGIALKSRPQSPIARLVADVAAFRLAWRHNHEFLSWLAFRRDDDKYASDDRLARLDAFKVEKRLLESRTGVIRSLGHHLAVALEAHDRFMLVNRWRPGADEESQIERLAWTLLSYQDPIHVDVELLRHRFDISISQDKKTSETDRLRDAVGEALVAEMAFCMHTSPLPSVATQTVAA